MKKEKEVLFWMQLVGVGTILCLHVAESDL